MRTLFYQLTKFYFGLLAT